MPDPFVVVEVGAGPGTLAPRAGRAAAGCAAALRYVLVERCEALRALHAELLPLEPVDEALGPGIDPGDPSSPDVVRSPGSGRSSRVDDLPVDPLEGVVARQRAARQPAVRHRRAHRRRGREVRARATTDDGEE